MNEKSVPVKSPCNAWFDASKVPPNRAERGVRIIRRLHVLDDFLGLCAAYVLAYLIRFGFDADPAIIVSAPVTGAYLGAFSQHEITYIHNAPLYLICLFVPLLALYAVSGMYEGDRRLRHTHLLWSLLVSNASLLALMSMVLYFRRNMWHMRGFLPLVLLLDIPCTWVLRRITDWLVDRVRRRHGTLLLPSLLVGEGQEADWLQRLSDSGRLKGHKIVRRAPMPQSEAEASELIQSVVADGISALFLMDAKCQQFDRHQTLLSYAICGGLESVVLSPHFLRLHNPFEYGDSIHGIPLVHYTMPGRHFAPSPLRNVLDRAAAAAAIVLASPVLLAIAIAIKLDDGGPVFFRQYRYGRGAKKFGMWKFRTMCVDAEAKLAALKDKNETDGALFKMHDDPRVTRIGHFLRCTSLDELPQLFNVLLGEMRFVGPRPLPCADIEPYLDSWQGFRQSVPPGITCVWQVSGRSDIGFDSMALLDGWYALNRTWMLDMRIALRTVWSVLFARGAY